MMTPSPSRRRSPSRETSPKRVNSFGNALPAKAKDDDLTLFVDMQKTEIENFLLEPSEDFDESISKLSFFPDVKLGINVPARGESSHDLLKVDGDKNDYEWLLTPPETPLFRSLDDEEEQSVSHASRGRAQSKSMHISRSSMMDNAQRSSRSSASPSRLSLSPHSMPRTMSPNSTSRASPPFSLQPLTPSRRPSTPPAAKILAPPRRSPSPVSRRMSTGSSGLALNGTRGASPVKSNHRSSSPKPQGWQSNDPSFSYDAPPNLRTSLPDRPVSHSRGGSPTSFSGLDTGSIGRRQSMCPTPTRRASSSHSIERDRLSMYSKASATSSGEDDLDSIQSISVSYSSCPAVKKSLAVMKTRTIASSKKPSKNFSPSSAPKRSFDSAVWLMDHRKAPQDRFRPLLSSVPATTLSAGKINNVHKPMFSYNSSVTTSSNASSEHGATFGHHIDSDQEQHDLGGEWEADHDGFRVHEDIFMFDKLDELNEETSYGKNAKYVNDTPVPVEHFKSYKKGFHTERNEAAYQMTYNGTSSSQVVHGKMATCSRCGNFFNVMDLDEKGGYCEECASKLGGFSADLMLWTSEEACQHDDKIAKSGPCVESELSIAPNSDYNKQASLDPLAVNNEPRADCTENCPPSQLMVDTDEDMLLGQEVLNHEANTMTYLVSDSLLENGDNISFSRSCVRNHQQTEPTSVEHGHYGDQTGNCNHGLPQCLNESDCQCNEAVSETRSGDNSHQLGLTAHPSPKAESAEGTGISVLLNQKSSSNKWPVMEGRALAATNIVCSEPYYTRDSINMMKRSFGRDSSSASSSIDLGSSRQSDGRFERLRNGKKGDFEKVQLSSTVSRQSIASVSDMSLSGSSASLCHQNDAIEDTCSQIDNLENSASRTMVSTEDGSSKDALSSAMECSCAARPIVSDDILVDVNSSSFDRFSETAEVTSQNHSMGRIAGNDHSSTSMCYSDAEMPSDIPESPAVEESSKLKTDEDTSDTTRCYLVGTPDPVEENFDNLLMQSEAVQTSVEEHILDDCCVSAISEEDVLVSRTGTSIMEIPNDGKSPEAVEGSMKPIQRCFTLEEATDTILFCSSIVHDLAYKAATIALEHEQESQHAKSTRPTVTIVGKSIPNEDGFLKLPHRRAPNRKVKRKRLEGELIITGAAEKEAIAKDSSPGRSASGFIRSPDNMKPPKLESKCNCVIM